MLTLMPHALAPDIAPLIVLSTVSPQVLDDFHNFKVEVPPILSCEYHVENKYFAKLRISKERMGNKSNPKMR